MSARRKTAPWLDERIAPNGNAVHENFKVWFAQSKIADSKGPLTVYHGTDEEVTIFDRGIAYFSDDKGGAGRYGGCVIRLYLSIQNPYVHDDTLFGPSPEFIEELKAKGHDGIISDGEDPGERYFITFYPEQVKSATHNSGDYDPHNACIVDTTSPAPSRLKGPSL